jgi:signal transduction histidine kinase
MSNEEPDFARFLGDRIAARKEALAGRWVEILEGQLRADARDIFPSDDLLNHIPEILNRIAEFVADPDAALLEALVVEDLARLAELRRRQGFGVAELLREYQVLADTLQTESEAAASDYQGPDDLRAVVAAIGRLKDATHLMSVVTARSFRLWQGRYERERQDLLETYGRVLGHELGNRLGAAETAIRLLQSDIEIEPERVGRLLDLSLTSIQRGLQTVNDVDALAKPVSMSPSDAPIGLPLLVTESIRLARAEAEEVGISVIVDGAIPSVRVLGPAVRVALSNLLGNAIKYHRSPPAERWVRVQCVVEGRELVITVEDNGPGIGEEDRERVFFHYFRGDVDEDGSGLGLAITRDAIERAGGAVSLHEGREGGARFVVRVPTADESSAGG